jgi:predicted ferric reductase
MVEQVPRWLVHAGWLTRPVRSVAANLPTTWQDLLRHAASDIGLYLGYIAIALVFIALVKIIPYHYFRRLHTLFPLAFLAMVFHSVVLLPLSYWFTAAGLVMWMSAVIGTVAAIAILTGRVGQNKRHVGTVKAVRVLGDDVLEVQCAIAGKGLKHRAGQFVIATFSGSRDPHPFTIASGGVDPNSLLLYIKALGDDTKAFMRELSVGASVTLEGPYGSFDFRGRFGRDQVWIGAGIGITPFLARLEKLAARPELQRPAKLYFCAPQSHPLVERVKMLCRRARVDFQLVDATRDGPLQLPQAMIPVSNKHQASLWFCGPQGFGDALETAWRAAGWKSTRFHREYFAFR